MSYNNHITSISSSKYILGDSLIELKKLKDHSVDMVFCDPPYNLQLSKTLYRPDATKVSGVNDDWDKFNNFQDYDIFTKRWLSEIKRILKPDGCLWVIGSYHNIYRIGYILQNLNFWILNDIIWRKTNPMPNFKGTRFTNAHETLIWAANSKFSKYTFNYQTMKQLNENKQMRSDDWLINICSGRERLKDVKNQKLHNTQKPEELLLRVVLSSTKPGDLVLDPFFGTGTTGVVCKKLGRKFIGIEKNATYIKEAKKRILKVKKIKSTEIKLLNKKISKKININSIL
jgi:DNA modification methylase